MKKKIKRYDLTQVIGKTIKNIQHLNFCGMIVKFTDNTEYEFIADINETIQIEKNEKET